MARKSPSKKFSDGPQRLRHFFVHLEFAANESSFPNGEGSFRTC